MSEDDKKHWEAKYSGGDYEPNQQPSALLTEWREDRLPGNALDLACGTGRNALYLAEKGYAVTGVDVSPRAIALAAASAREKGLNINWIVADLDSYAIPGPYDLMVINFFYINRNLVVPLTAALNEGGLLFYENIMLAPDASEEEKQKHRFHFRPGELQQLFPGLKTIRYEERQVAGKDGLPAYIAGLVAQKE